MTVTGAGRRLAAALDRVLVPVGFQAGQGGPDDGQVIWCGGHDELSEACPRLPQAFQQSSTGTCIDLVVDISGDGTLLALSLEALSVADTLCRLGLEDDADAVSALAGRPVGEALPALPDALGHLFARAAGPAGGAGAPWVR